MINKNWSLSDLKGSYVLVTGGSEGLGLSFANELAKNGIHLVLVARNQERLNRIAEQLQKNFNVDVIPLSFDLSDVTAPMKIRSALVERNIKIRGLINNAAFGYWGEFQNQPLTEIQKMLNLNVMSLITLCHLFIPDLTSYEFSLIINLSSVASYQPIPYMAAYAATKAMVQSFSQALHWELKNQGVYVQTLAPGALGTEFNSKIGFDMSRTPSAWTSDKAVQASIQGLRKKEILTLAAKNVFLQKLFVNFFPLQVVLKSISNLFKPS